MNLRQIEVFRAVMLAGSVNGGAAMLHVSAPAVSRLIAHLEQRLGVALFERRGARLHATPQARALMREIDGAYPGIERVRRAAAALRFGSGERLRLATNLSTGLELVPRAAARLRQRLSALKISIEVLPLAAIREGLAAGDFDLGIGAFIDADAGPLRRRRIGSGSLVAVAPAGHPIARLAKVDAAALRDVEFVSYGRIGTHGQQLERRLGFDTREPAFEVPYAYMACALVACGLGVSVVDDLTLRHFGGAGLVARPLDPAIDYAIEVLSDPHRAAPSAVPACIEALEAEWAALRAPAPVSAAAPRRPARRVPPAARPG